MNAANRKKLYGLRSWSASMRPAATGHVSWTKGSKPTVTHYQSCSLMLVHGTTVRNITGKWSHGTVSGWQFWPSTRATSLRADVNVRIRPDGRLARTY